MATIDYFDMMERAEQHAHDPAQYHLTEYGARTDGGDRQDGGVDVGDTVTVRDEDQSDDPGPWKVRHIKDGTAILWSALQPIRREPVDDLTVVEEPGADP